MTASAVTGTAIIHIGADYRNLEFAFVLHTGDINRYMEFVDIGSAEFILDLEFTQLFLDYRKVALDTR